MQSGLMRYAAQLAACSVFGLVVGCARVADAELQITYPPANSTVPGRVIELSGSGADPDGTLEVEVLTNEWYPQTGVPKINRDGSWTYAPCHLGGQGEYNNHTIRVNVVKDGKRGSSASVRGVVRQ